MFELERDQRLGFFQKFMGPKSAASEKTTLERCCVTQLEVHVGAAGNAEERFTLAERIRELRVIAIEEQIDPGRDVLRVRRLNLTE